MEWTTRLILSSAFRLRPSREVAGKFLQNAVGLQVEHILGTNLRGRLGEAVVELHRGPRSTPPASSFSSNTKTESPTEIWSPWRSRALLHRATVDERAVAAVEIANLVAVLSRLSTQ